MALKVTRIDTWAVTIEDQPGGLAGKLRALADSKANLEFVIARRAPDRPGTGVAFVTPIGGPAQRKAKQAGFAKSATLHTVRIQGPDKPGEGARIAAALANAGLDLRGLSAAALGKTFVCHVALDSAGGRPPRRCASSTPAGPARRGRVADRRHPPEGGEGGGRPRRRSDHRVAMAGARTASS